MAASQERDEHPFQQFVLPDDGLLDLVERLLQGMLRSLAGGLRSGMRWP
jgi:hypothetical protein